MVANFLAGGAAVNVLAAQVGAQVVVVDVGVATDLAPAAGCSLGESGAGTADLSREPAMSRGEARQALLVGARLAYRPGRGRRARAAHRRHGHRQHHRLGGADRRVHRGRPGNGHRSRHRGRPGDPGAQGRGRHRRPDPPCRRDREPGVRPARRAGRARRAGARGDRRLRDLGCGATGAGDPGRRDRRRRGAGRPGDGTARGAGVHRRPPFRRTRPRGRAGPSSGCAPWSTSICDWERAPAPCSPCRSCRRPPGCCGTWPPSRTRTSPGEPGLPGRARAHRAPGGDGRGRIARPAPTTRPAGRRRRGGARLPDDHSDHRGLAAERRAHLAPAALPARGPGRRLVRPGADRQGRGQRRGGRRGRGVTRLLRPSRPRGRGNRSHTGDRAGRGGAGRGARRGRPAPRRRRPGRGRRGAARGTARRAGTATPGGWRPARGGDRRWWSRGPGADHRPRAPVARPGRCRHRRPPGSTAAARRAGRRCRGGRCGQAAARPGDGAAGDQRPAGRPCPPGPVRRPAQGRGPVRLR